MVVEISYSSYFLHKIKRLTQKEKKLLGKFESIFRQDCFDARLKTHKLSGKLEGLWSCSLDYKNRILFKFNSDNEVVLVDVGSHDIYK